MARSISIIKNQILAEKAAQPALSGLTSTSATAIFNLWAYIQAVAINLVEQLTDLKVTTIENLLTTKQVPTNVWLQTKVFEFQYSATTPQVVQLVNFAPVYNPVNTALRIVSRCSVKTTGQRIVTVKVATGEPPAALSAPQLSALSGYITQGGDGTVAGAGTGIAFAGVQINVSSTASDKIYLKATINYNGQYSSIIGTNVISAIDAYLAAIPFDGNVRVLNLVDAIQNVAGVTDILIEDLAIRANSTAFASKTYLIQNYTQTLTTYPTFAGYVVGETTAGNTLLDSLTFVAQ